jgi:acetyl-CoA carboxylase carboxyl transferase subunit alpha
MATRLKAVLVNEIDALSQVPVQELVERRYRRLRSYGAYETA